MMLNERRIRLDMLVERPNSQWSAEAWPEGICRAYNNARHCEACFLVYDVTSRASFEAAKWLPKLLPGKITIQLEVSRMRR